MPENYSHVASGDNAEMIVKVLLYSTFYGEIPLPATLFIAMWKLGALEES